MRTCPKCGRAFYSHQSYGGHMSAHKRSETPSPIPGINMQQYCGHKGIRTFADRYAGGDIALAKDMLWRIGFAASDPTPWNGGSSRGSHYWNHVKAVQRGHFDTDNPSPDMPDWLALAHEKRRRR